MHSFGPVRHQEEVVLNVYDLAPGFNAWAGPAGLGVYHSGVQIYGTEYTFGNDGVMTHSPRNTGDPNCPFRVGIVLGKLTGMTRRDVEQAVYALRSSDFVPGTYSLLQRNCNHFAAGLVRALLGKSIPAWVNRISSVGVCCSCLLPKEALGDPVSTSSSSSSSRGGPTRFRGSGHSLGGGGGESSRAGGGGGSGRGSSSGGSGGGGGGGDLVAERRALMAAAAEARRKKARERKRLEATAAADETAPASSTSH